MADMEVGGEFRERRCNKSNGGELLPEIVLPSVDGRQVRLSKYRGRLNLVLILVGGEGGENVLQLLDEVAGRYAEFVGEETKVVVVLLDDRPRHDPLKERVKDWPFAVLNDTESRARRSFRAFDLSETACPAIFIADRYGEVYAEYYTQGWQRLPKTAEILQWLVFINSQCPECGAPEWTP